MSDTGRRGIAAAAGPGDQPLPSNGVESNLEANAAGAAASPGRRCLRATRTTPRPRPPAATSVAPHHRRPRDRARGRRAQLCQPRQGNASRGREQSSSRSGFTIILDRWRYSDGGLLRRSLGVPPQATGPVRRPLNRRYSGQGSSQPDHDRAGRTHRLFSAVLAGTAGDHGDGDRAGRCPSGENSTAAPRW
jgi:hypothetical protein